MNRSSLRYLLPIALGLAWFSSAQAQNTRDNSQAPSQQSLYPRSDMGGTATTGTGIRTGQGPLTKPIPPAVSTTNPQQNPQYPINRQGPVQTNPPQEPFGSR